MMKRLAGDRSGRVPFSIVAIVILVGSVATGAYMQQVSKEAGERQGRSAGNGPDTLAQVIQADLAEIAGRCIDNAVDRQTDIDMDEGSQGLWSVDRNFRSYFDIELEREWGRKEMGRYCLTVEAGESTLQLGTYPMTIRAINRLGMGVNMTAPAGFRISGSVNFTFIVQDRSIQKKVDFELERPSWYPLALFQANRLRRDCASEGLLELLFRQMFEGYLDADFAEVLEARNRTRQSNPSSTATVADWWKKRPFETAGFNAMDYAMMMEEQALFGGSRYNIFGGLLDSLGATPVALQSALDHPDGIFRGVDAFNESGSGLKLSFTPFVHGMTAAPVNASGPGAAHFDFSVGSEWQERPQPFFRKVAYAGEEVEVDVYVLEVDVNGVYRLRVGPDKDHLMKIDIPVHLQFQMDHRIHEKNRPWSEEGRLHCEIEDLKLFQSEYAGLYSTPLTVGLDITNSSGVQARDMTGTAGIDVMLDGDYLGTFRRGEVGGEGLVLTNVPSGPHEISVLWNGARTGETEQGAAAVILNDTGTALQIQTTSDIDTSLFWTYALEFVRDVPPATRLARLFQYISLQAGFPAPTGVETLGPGTPGYHQIMMTWLAGMETRLDSTQEPGKLSDPSRLAVLKGSAAILKVVRELLKIIDKAKLGTITIGQGDAGLQANAAAASVGYGTANGAETVACAVNGAGGEVVASFERTPGGNGWAARGSGQTTSSAGGVAGKGVKIRLGAAVDIAVIAAMVFSAYLKYVRYEATDGKITESERIDLELDCLNVVVRVGKMVVAHTVKNYAKSIANPTQASRVVSGAFGVITAVIQITQCIYDENVKFRGDPEFWSALFTGFDQDTIGVYLALSSLAIFLLEIIAGLGYLTAVQPWLAPISAAIALCAIIVFMVMDWKSFSTAVSGTLSDSDRDNMAKSIRGTLRDTAGTVARLNDYPADAEMLAARQARGAASMMWTASAFVPDQRLSYETRNLSMFQYDTAWAKEHQARAVRSLRFFMIAMWDQACEFGGKDWTWLHPLYEQSWDSKITITWPDGQSSAIDSGYVGPLLLGMNGTSFEKYKIDFSISGRVVADRINEWLDPMARIGDQVRLWNKRLTASQTMKTYLLGLDGTRYRNDWGYLQVRLSPTYTSCELTVTGPELFDIQDGRTSATASRFTKSLTGREEPYRLYLEPGTYTLEFSNQRPDLALDQKSRRATVTVGNLYSPLFGQDPVNVIPKPGDIYFQIFNEYNGTIKVTVDLLDDDDVPIGGLDTDFRYNNTTKQSGREYINNGWVPGFCFDGSPPWLSEEQQRSLTYRILFTVALDRDNDGYYESISARTVSLNDIRNDQKSEMKKDNGKFTDQLGYRLTILNEPEKQLYGVDAEGNDVYRDQYIVWKKMD
jgi:hypothetical protein